MFVAIVEHPEPLWPSEHPLHWWCEEEALGLAILVEDTRSWAR